MKWQKGRVFWRTRHTIKSGASPMTELAQWASRHQFAAHFPPKTRHQFSHRPRCKNAASTSPYFSRSIPHQKFNRKKKKILPGVFLSFIGPPLNLLDSIQGTCNVYSFHSTRSCVIQLSCQCQNMGLTVCIQCCRGPDGARHAALVNLPLFTQHTFNLWLTTHANIYTLLGKPDWRLIANSAPGRRL